ncbi:leucine-rich repeat-containing protein 59-like isoform X1 [Nyctibius grandis]|uniref:leucine-rich repeat-containing protein 59-like isoform X1 n=1 Tax=Nyctibius grandis TaxID=48427 RepID=UPI0035BC5850
MFRIKASEKTRQIQPPAEKKEEERRRVERRGKSEREEERRQQAEERARERRSGQRHLAVTRQQRRKKKKGVVWNGEARASEKRSGGSRLKSGHESGALGKGTSRSRESAAGTFGVPRLALRWATSL